jgi:hypothetical protein
MLRRLEPEAGARPFAGSYLSHLVRGGSEASDEPDASFLGIAEEPVLAGLAPIHRSAVLMLPD